MIQIDDADRQHRSIATQHYSFSDFVQSIFHSMAESLIEEEYM